MNGTTIINTCTSYCGCGGCFEKVQDSNFDLSKLQKNLDFEYFIEVADEDYIYFYFDFDFNEVRLIKSEYLGEPYELTEANLKLLIDKVSSNNEFETESDCVSDWQQFGMSGTL